MVFSDGLHMGLRVLLGRLSSITCKGLMEAQPKDATELDKAESRDVSKDVTG